jgi:hypothetical protein
MSAIAALFLLLALLLPSSLPALALNDTPQNREQQADRYLEAVPPQSMMNDMSAKMAQTLPEEQRDQFKALMTKHLDLGRVTAAIKAAMVKTFTADELKALADFYGSDVGKSAMSKMGTYMSEVMPATMNEVQSALMKAQGEAHQEHPEQGSQDKGSREN